MGRYVPPDVEGTTTGNKLHKKKPPSFSRDGTQTVRFEMPFAIWCEHCEKAKSKPTPIGQGVRFNAAKRKVGMYHTTPIFAFRMRHAECAGAIEIRTDPQNTAYVVTEGARKRDTGEDAASSSAPILTDKEREGLRNNAFAKLEKTIEDRQVLAQAKERIGELEHESARKWEDPYERNRQLRNAFRVGRKEREHNAQATEDLRDRMSLGIDLVAASEDDARRASLVDFGPSSNDGEPMGRRALAKPLFASSADSSGKDTKDEGKNTKKRLKSEVAAAQRRDNLVSEIVGNTRVAHDPFLSLDRNTGESAKTPLRIPGVKRKRVGSEPKGHSEEPEIEAKGGTETTKATTSSTALVEYDSD